MAAVLAGSTRPPVVGKISRQGVGITTGRLPVRLHQRPASSTRLLCRAEGEEQSGAASSAPQAVSEPEQRPQQPPAPQAPLLAKGQGTAIVTGAVSVLFGVAYLVLVQLLDMRGGELQPPPPEAFIP